MLGLPPMVPTARGTFCSGQKLLPRSTVHVCVGGAPAWSKSSVTKRRSPWTDVQSQSLSLSEATDWSRGDQEGSDTEGERKGRD